jgi:hypothetical protein
MEDDARCVQVASFNLPQVPVAALNARLARSRLFRERSNAELARQALIAPLLVVADAASVLPASSCLTVEPPTVFLAGTGGSMLLAAGLNAWHVLH